MGGPLVSGQKNQEGGGDKSRKPWAKGWVGRAMTLAGGGSGVCHGPRKELNGQETGKVTPLPAPRLFKFVVLIDNVFHFFRVGGI